MSWRTLAQSVERLVAQFRAQMEWRLCNTHIWQVLCRKNRLIRILARLHKIDFLIRGNTIRLSFEKVLSVDNAICNPLSYVLHRKIYNIIVLELFVFNWYDLDCLIFILDKSNESLLIRQVVELSWNILIFCSVCHLVKCSILVLWIVLYNFTTVAVNRGLRNDNLNFLLFLSFSGLSNLPFLLRLPVLIGNFKVEQHFRVDRVVPCAT